MKEIVFIERKSHGFDFHKWKMDADVVILKDLVAACWKTQTIKLLEWEQKWILSSAKEGTFQYLCGNEMRREFEH